MLLQLQSSRNKIFYVSRHVHSMISAALKLHKVPIGPNVPDLYDPSANDFIIPFIFHLWMDGFVPL